LGIQSPQIFRAVAGRALQHAAESLFAIFFPSACRICQSSLTSISMLPVCQPCLGQIAGMEGVLCSICGDRLLGHAQDGETGPLCGICRLAAPLFRRAVAYGAYEGVLRDLIHLFKYQQIRPTAAFLAKLIVQVVQSVELPDSLLVIPVPLWRGKRRARGFNQAEDIARSFVRSRAAAASIQLDTSSLIRRRETVSQIGLTRGQRRANLRGAFAVTRPLRLRDRSVLLIDDVMTTGTTAGECARVLLRAGAKEVFVATAARATRQSAGGLTVAMAASVGGTQGHA
jgi:ComF family protein